MKKIFLITGLMICILFAHDNVSAVVFSDDFEEYANGDDFTTAINGWHSPTGTVIVQSAQVNGGTLALKTPSSSTISNTLNKGQSGIVWVDQYVRPCLGAEPSSVPDSNSAVNAFFDGAGYLEVGNNGAWDVCVQDVFGNAAEKADGTSWVRISIYHNFSAGTASILLNGHVLRQNIPFNGSNISEYKELLYRNMSDAALIVNDAYVDDVSITTSLPVGLDSGPDGDSDGIVDAVEINDYGTTKYNSRYPQTLTFTDNFESYSDGDKLVNLASSGWNASDTGVVVQTAEVYEGTKSVFLPQGEMASNRFSSASQRIWSDFYVYPPLGAKPQPRSERKSVRLYFNEDGYVTLATNDTEWIVCSNSVFGNPVTPVSSNEWVRISIFQDYAKKQVAVLLNGRVLRDEWSFIDSDINVIGGLSFINNGGTAPTQPDAYLDKVYVSPSLPSGFTIDEDKDFMVDAEEIQLYGTAKGTPQGMFLIIR